MKKTLIALAALAATGAFAQSSVTISGTMDATLRSTSVSTATTTTTNTKIGKDGQGTSNVTFSGTEDIGGGLKALFLYEMDFDFTTQGANRNGTLAPSAADVNTMVGPLGGGQAFVGLSGGFGAIKLGAANSPSLSTQGARSPFGTKDGGRGGVYAGLMGSSITRLDNSINYATPSMSGFSAAVSYTPAQADSVVTAVGAAEGGSMTDIGLFFANGPLSVGVSNFARSAYNNGTAVDSGNQTTWYVGYDFKVAKATLGGHTQNVRSAANAKTESTGVSLGLTAPLSATTSLSYSYQRLDDTGANDRDSQMNAIGVNYALSKRTNVYATYGYQTTNNVAAGSTEKGSTTLVGLRHNF